jgi:hypothetical protein
MNKKILLITGIILVFTILGSIGAYHYNLFDIFNSN